MRGRRGGGHLGIISMNRLFNVIVRMTSFLENLQIDQECNEIEIEPGLFSVTISTVFARNLYFR